MLKRRTFIMSAAAASATAGLGLAPARAQAQWPNRPITLIVPWGAGGGTDAVARIYASLLEKELGQPVNVVNRTGGNGVVGHSAIATAPPDGYTIGLATVEIGMMKWAGIADLNYKAYTPLALVNNDPAGIQVRTDSPYKTVKDLADAIRANPGKMKASGTSQGGIWHLALAGWLQAMNLPPDAVPWVPSNGAAPGMQDLVAGGVEIVPCSLPEARAMIDAGRARSLAVMASTRNAAFPNVPTLKEAMGIDWTMAAWRGLVAPRNLPAPIVERIVPVIKKVYDSKEYSNFMAQRGFGMIWGDPKAFERHMAEDFEKMGQVMKAVGIAKT